MQRGMSEQEVWKEHQVMWHVKINLSSGPHEGPGESRSPACTHTHMCIRSILWAIEWALPSFLLPGDGMGHSAALKPGRWSSPADNGPSSDCLCPRCGRQPCGKVLISAGREVLQPDLSIRSILNEIPTHNFGYYSSSTGCQFWLGSRLIELHLHLQTQSKQIISKVMISINGMQKLSLLLF